MRKTIIGLTISFAVSITLFTSCRKRVASENLEVRNSIVYVKNEPKPFSGISYSKFESGRISGETTYVDGIPNGPIFDYGYQGEIIHSGICRPLNLNITRIADFSNIKRIDLSTVDEGGTKFSNIYIVIPNFTKQEYVRNAVLNRIIADTLNNHHIKINKDSIYIINVGEIPVAQ